MKRLLLLALVLLLAACRGAATAPPTPAPQPGDPRDRSIFAAGLTDAARPILDGLDGASLYQIELEIADDLLRIRGRQTVYYTNTEVVDLSEIRLRLFPNVLGGRTEITRAAVNGEAVRPFLELNDSLLILSLSEPLHPGAGLTLELDFEVKVPDTLERNYGVLAAADDVLALAHVYPMVAVYDDEGWNAEIPPQSGDVTYADAAFFVVQVRAPRGLTLVGSGREVDRSEADRAQVVTFAAGPARDFYLTASPDHETVTRRVGQVELRFHAPGDLQAGAEAGLEYAARALEIFSERYGAYPYIELDLVSTPTLALGIEYPGMIAITEHILAPEDDYLEATVVHEVAHQWFYGLVGNDQLDDPWLDEALAQWATLQYYTDEYGPSGAAGFRGSLTGRWQRADGELIPIGLPVAAYSGGEYGSIVYGRGPLFFEALRDEMGGEAFDAFLKAYVAENAWGVATPEKLKEAAEDQCGCNLTGLFEAWVYP